MQIIHRLALTIVSLVWLAACGAPADEDAPGPIGTTSSAIRGGTTTTSRPEIGLLFAGGQAICTATLISSRYALTAGHCARPIDYRNLVAQPGDFVRLAVGTSSVFDASIAGYEKFGGLESAGLWTAFVSDAMLIRLAAPVPVGVATAVALAHATPTLGNEVSTMFGFGCTSLSTPGLGFGVLRFRAFTGLTTDIGCFGDSGGPILFGNGVGARPQWGIETGQASDVFRGGTFDTMADAVYYRFRIEALMRSFDAQGRLQDVFLPGNSYRAFAAASADVCASSCSGDFRCRAWSQALGICTLKDNIGNWNPSPASVSGFMFRGGIEQNTDRPGSDYGVFGFVGSDDICVTRCATDFICQSATMTGPDASGVRLCHLKNRTPQVVSAFGVRSVARRGLEAGFQRLGHVYNTFNNGGFPQPELCEAMCAGDSRCRAWKYRYVGGTTEPECSHMDTNDGRVAGMLWISGVKGQEFTPAAYP